MHYKDGRLANAGDVLKTINGRIGTIVSIMPGCKACNAQVAVHRVSTPEKVYHHVDVKVIHSSEGLRFISTEIITETLGECEKLG